MAEDTSSSMGNKVEHDSDQPCELSHKFLKKITNDFDKSLIVGSGTFGIVYKGTYENGEEIAVKVLKDTSGFETTEDFNKELKNLRRLKHQNVVKLVGFCKESKKFFAEHNGKKVVAEQRHTSLCFEYVCNGSLDKHIYDDGCSGLNWHILYNIIKGICQGLEYLRHGLEFSVWHLDLKPANILLDNNMIPKLADFGLSKLLFGDETTRKSINRVGTRSFPKVLIDGPYGAPAQDYEQYDVVLLVGLGIGATPMISIIKDIINNMKRLDVDVESGDPGDAGASSTSSFRTRQAYFYWVTREQGSEWFRGVLDELAKADKKGVIELHSHCSNVYEEGDALIPILQSLNHGEHGIDVVAGTRVKTHFGRPDWRKVYERIALRHGGERVGVFYCGEPVLMEELRNLAKDFSTNTNTKFDFHSENFY